MPGQFLKNYANYNYFARQTDMRNFLKPVVHNTWSQSNQLKMLDDISPGYIKVENTLSIPFGFLQSPLVWFQPISLAFGSLGQFIGKSEIIQSKWLQEKLQF